MAERALATAFVNIVPGTRDLETYLKGKLQDDVEGAGDGAGKKLGTAASGGLIKNFAIGGAIAGAVSAVTNQVMNAMSDLARDAISASDATDKFKKTLDFAGLDTTTIEKLTKSTQAYADKTVYNISDIQGITAQLAANGVNNYDKLAEAAGNLNSIAGGNAETFKSVGMVLTQTAGAGKLTTENWNQLANAIPGASGKVQEALLKNGAFTGNFRDAMAEGQITSEEFNTALMQLGTDPIAVEAAKSTDTFEGALGNLQATIVGKMAEALTGMKPMLTDAINGLSDFAGSIPDKLSAIGKWVDDNKIWLGILAGVIMTVMLPAIVVWVASTVAAWVSTTVAAVTNAALQLVEAYKTVGGWVMMGVQAIVNAAKVVAGWVMTAVGAAANFAITAVYYAGMVAGWVLMGAQALGNAAKVVLGWVISAAGAVANAAVMVVQFGIIVGGWILMGIQALIGAAAMAAAWLIAIWPIALVIAVIIMNWETISRVTSEVWNAIVKFVVDAWNGLVRWVTSAVNGFVSWWKGAWNNVVDFFSTVFSGIGDVVRGTFEGVVGFIKGVINSVIDVVNGAISGINSLGAAIRDATGGAIDIKLGKIPHLAKGGYVDQPTTALIGEAGPEVVTPLKDFERMMGIGNGNGNGSTVNYYAAPNQSIDSEQALFTALKRAKVVAAW